MTEKNEKELLLTNSSVAFNKLFEVIDTIPKRKRGVSVETSERDENFKDVLMHLYEWHAMLERWYREGMSGDVPAMPAPGYKWRDINMLNQQIKDNYNEVTLSQAMKKIKLSHDRVMALIDTHTNEEIVTKKYYKWTKSSNLLSYFKANMSHHYEWAIKKCEGIATGIIEMENDKVTH